MPNTAIERMRARYVSELRDSEARTLAIKAKLQVLDELSAEEKQIGVTVDTPSVSQPKGPSGAFLLSSTLTEAARAVVDHYGKETPLTNRQVIDLLGVNGFPPKGKNFTAIVLVTLKRLAKNGRIFSEQREDGKLVFRANPV